MYLNTDILIILLTADTGQAGRQVDCWPSGIQGTGEGGGGVTNKSYSALVMIFLFLSHYF